MRWIALTVATAGCAGFACRSQRSYSASDIMGSIEAPRLTESSGIAPSGLMPGAYFTHNDSGSSPTLFLFRPSGELIREVTIEAAMAIDWEDMAFAKLDDGGPYLFIGDIGDNGGVRKHITIYRVREASSKTLKPDRVYDLVYPDEPRNAETLLIHPKTGSITIVTKTSRERAFVYGIELPKRSGRVTLKRLGRIAIPESFAQARSVTGGAWSPDGKHVVLRTYLSGFEYDANEGTNWFEAKPRRVPFGLLPQAEAICYSRDGSDLLTTSEGSPCPVMRVRINR